MEIFRLDFKFLGMENGMAVTIKINFRFFHSFDGHELLRISENLKLSLWLTKDSFLGCGDENRKRGN
jgi:hypothetical protein